MTMDYEHIITDWYEFYYPYCKACSPNCKQCSSQNIDECYECANHYTQSTANSICDSCVEGYIFNSQGKCEVDTTKCERGWYKTSTGICEVCNPRLRCSACSNNDSCDECMNARNELVSGTCVCKEGYY
jgi:hypothetical protein